MHTSVLIPDPLQLKSYFAKIKLPSARKKLLFVIYSKRLPCFL